MSAIFSILSIVHPWSLTRSSPSEAIDSTIFCETTAAPTFGLDDSDSWATPRADNNIITASTHLPATANFHNPNNATIHCLKYGKFVHSIPKPHRPPNCDFILYSDDKRSFLRFVELKIPKPANPQIGATAEEDKQIKIKWTEKKKRTQLRKMLESLMGVPSMKTFMEAFSSKHCCYFLGKPPSSLPLLLQQTVDEFNRWPLGHGLQITNTHHAFQEHGFELWRFSDKDVCKLG